MASRLLDGARARCRGGEGDRISRMGVETAGTKRRGRRWWVVVLLALPYVGLCFPQIYARATPALLGFRDGACAEGAGLLSGAQIATDDGSVGHPGLVTDLLRDELDAAGEEIEGYACGPPAMLEAVRLMCSERGIPAQLALESGMACGFGACFGCVVPTRHGYVRLCLDGPVLDAAVLETAAVAGAGH